MPGMERAAAPDVSGDDDSDETGDGSQSGGEDEDEEEGLLSPAGSVAGLRRLARSEGFATTGTGLIIYRIPGRVGSYGTSWIRITWYRMVRRGRGLTDPTLSGIMFKGN